MRSCREFATEAIGASRYRYSDELRENLRLCASELATNAVRHSKSGEAGGVFTVLLHLRPTWIGLALHDLGPKAGAPSVPRVLLRTLDDPLSASGRGLAMVSLCSHGRYGFMAPPQSSQHVAWCELAA
ncbi:hypothetical protein GCM10022402_40230 [Salinactinospora qingdaonensis]|uniref:Histidine kinase/HSP90-like ATPase domain-containing protein n=1 Tax=Salinactinospora qingdaonensis TaxID=702744 RepID=A0ABP7GBH4_9ACTN